MDNIEDIECAIELTYLREEFLRGNPSNKEVIASTVGMRKQLQKDYKLLTGKEYMPLARLYN
jgi:hypothetical protein